MNITGTLRALGSDRGAVRVEALYDTDVDDLWQACTEPERLARWIADVQGDLRLGGEFEARFTSGWEGTGRVQVCEPPHRLVVLTREAGESAECLIEATLSSEGEQTRLVIEQSGLPVDGLPAYGAGWQVHLEDLGAHLAGGERCDLKARWNELIAGYRAVAIG
jgi:uncharacterized protein YndB with AHSA1/START domain